MKLLKIDFTMENKYYRFNEDHLVRVYERNKDMIYVYVMDNNEKRLNQRWCKNTTMNEIEKIASELLYNLGYDGQTVEYYISEGEAIYYLPNSNDIEFPIDIHYFKYNPTISRYTSGIDTIDSAEEYLNAMIKHQENEDTIESIGSIFFGDIEDNIYRINEYANGALSGLHDMADTFSESFQKTDQGLRKEIIDQLYKVCNMNTYLMDKTIELNEKLPNKLYLKYPDR